MVWAAGSCLLEEDEGYNSQIYNYLPAKFQHFASIQNYKETVMWQSRDDMILGRKISDGPQITNACRKIDHQP